MQATAGNIGPVLPAFAYGMNLQLVRGQPQMPMEPFRILTTCSWEQNAYTVKIYVPLHGVKTDLLRAVFQPHTLDIKAINLQVGGPGINLCLNVLLILNGSLRYSGILAHSLGYTHRKSYSSSPWFCIT